MYLEQGQVGHPVGAGDVHLLTRQLRENPGILPRLYYIAPFTYKHILILQSLKLFFLFI